MKRARSLSAFFLLFSLFFTTGCGSGGDEKGGKDENEKEKTASADMKKVDMSQKGLRATIQVPKKDPQKGIRPAEFERDQRGRLTIKAGKNFGISILEGPPIMSMEEKKEDIRTMNQALETDFIEEKEGLLIYKYGVPGSDKEMFHFYMVRESDGKQYVIESLSSGEFSRKQVDRMIRSAKSLTPQKKESA